MQAVLLLLSLCSVSSFVTLGPTGRPFGMMRHHSDEPHEILDAPPDASWSDVW